MRSQDLYTFLLRRMSCQPQVTTCRRCGRLFETETAGAETVCPRCTDAFLRVEPAAPQLTYYKRRSHGTDADEDEWGEDQEKRERSVPWPYRRPRYAREEG